MERIFKISCLMSRQEKQQDNDFTRLLVFVFLAEGPKGHFFSPNILILNNCQPIVLAYKSRIKIETFVVRRHAQTVKVEVAKERTKTADIHGCQASVNDTTNAETFNNCNVTAVEDANLHATRESDMSLQEVNERIMTNYKPSTFSCHVITPRSFELVQLGTGLSGLFCGNERMDDFFHVAGKWSTLTMNFH